MWRFAIVLVSCAEMPKPDTLPREALELNESVASFQVSRSIEDVLESAPADVQARVRLQLQEAATHGNPTAGLVPLYVIRPGIGRGKGSHLYEADMLSRNAQVFKGWKMYVDHLSEAARKALGGLPRSVRDLGGRLTETWWDPSVPADESRGFGQGAVVGLSKPVPYVKELVDNDPELVEASIAARATGVQQRNVGGQRVWVVEGIEPKGSVDWVTEAGAGGKVVSLIEAHYDEAEAMSFLTSLSDEDLVAHIRDERPDLATKLAEAVKDPEDAADGGADEALEDEIKRLMKKGLSRDMATKAAKKNVQEGADGSNDNEEDDVPITPEALREAFASEEGSALLDELLEGRVEARLEDILPGKLEEALAEERELLMIEARADAERQIQIRDMRDEAHRIIAEAKLPAEFAEVARAKFDLTENGPTPALDVLDELDDDGKVTKTAEEILAESVAEEVAHQRRLLAAANPTRVRVPVARTGTDGGEDGGDGGDADKTTGSPRTDAILVEAGHNPETLDEVYG